MTRHAAAAVPAGYQLQLPQGLHSSAPASGGSHASSSAAALSTQPLASTALAQRQPYPATYKVQVAVKAFEKRYLDQATNTISDLLFITFKPKASPAGSEPGSATPSNLDMHMAFKPVPLDWRKTRFTVTKGPHIDKYGMEQFEMRKYKASASITTGSMQEVQWFLDSIKLYDFPGVQVQVVLTSSNYLTATQLPEDAAPITSSSSVLSEHRKHIARYLPPGSAQGSSSGSSSSSSSGATAAAASDVRATLQSLRHVLHAGLQEQRQQLGTSPNYKQWHASQKLSTPHVTAKLPEGLAAGRREARDHLLQNVLHSSDVGAAGRPAAQGELAQHSQAAAAFLAAVDAVLLSLRMDALEVHKHYPMHFTTYRVGQHQVPAAEWMQAVLQAGQVASKVEAASKESELLAAYATYSMFAHALLSTLFRMWMQQTAAQIKPHLALPPQEVAASFMQQRR